MTERNPFILYGPLFCHSQLFTLLVHNTSSFVNGLIMRIIHRCIINILSSIHLSYFCIVPYLNEILQPNMNIIGSLDTLGWIVWPLIYIDKIKRSALYKEKLKVLDIIVCVGSELLNVKLNAISSYWNQNIFNLQCQFKSLWVFWLCWFSLPICYR